MRGAAVDAAIRAATWTLRLVLALASFGAGVLSLRGVLP
jgi:hypothetical protein